MGFGLYSVKDPSQFVTGSMGGAAATASKMMKEQPEKPGPSVGGAIAMGVAGAALGKTIASDIGVKKGLPTTAKPGKPGATAMAHQLETAETAKAGMKVIPGAPATGMTQSKFEKYGQGAGAIAGAMMHIFS